jgi:hypothetical protein
LLFEEVVIFPTKEAAANELAAEATPAGESCWLASSEAFFEFLEPGSAPAATLVEFPSLTEHGDQQLSRGIELRSTTGTSSGHFLLNQAVWIQVGRALIRINLANDAEGATDVDPLGILEMALRLAVDSLKAELATG